MAVSFSASGNVDGKTRLIRASCYLNPATRSKTTTTNDYLRRVCSKSPAYFLRTVIFGRPVKNQLRRMRITLLFVACAIHGANARKRCTAAKRARNKRCVSRYGWNFPSEQPVERFSVSSNRILIRVRIAVGY